MPIWTFFSSNDLEGQSQLTPFSVGIRRAQRYKFGANPMTPIPQKRDELSRGQAHFKPILIVLTPNDLDGQSTPLSIGF